MFVHFTACCSLTMSAAFLFTHIELQNRVSSTRVKRIASNPAPRLRI